MIRRSQIKRKRRKMTSARTSLRFEVIDGAFRRYPDGREVCLNTVKGKREYEQRKYAMAERQSFHCCLCNDLPFLDASNTTFEHSDGRGMGGARRDDRIEIDGKPVNGAAHGWCNAKKGSKRENLA